MEIIGQKGGGRGGGGRRKQPVKTVGRERAEKSGVSAGKHMQAASGRGDEKTGQKVRQIANRRSEPRRSYGTSAKRLFTELNMEPNK